MSAGIIPLGGRPRGLTFAPGHRIAPGVDGSDLRAQMASRAARAAPTPAPLTATDASFLLLERGGSHMHIGGLLVFDGPAPDQDDVRRHVSERLGLVPRFRQRVVEAPLGLSRPWWVDDPHFNIDYHVRRTALPEPGDERRLQALVGRIFSQRLDRGKPLWEMWVVEGLSEDRFALVTKVHHALVDGVSGVDLASVILDPTPNPPPIRSTPVDRRPMPSGAELFVRSAAQNARAPLAAAMFAAGALLYPRGVRQGVAAAAAAAGAIGQELLDPAPSVPLNGPIGPHRRYGFCHLPLDEVREIKERHRATVNDVVLAVATGALRGWLRHRGVRTEGLELRALVPVSLRRQAERGLLGNRLALLRAPLPVYAADPARRLALVRDRMRGVKESRQLMAAQTIIGLSDFAPPTILAQASRLNFSTRLYNIIVTNVPGPQEALYLLGHRLQSMAPIAFLPPGHALSIAVFSYHGLLTFGLLGDYDRLDDIAVVTEGLGESLAELTGRGNGRGDGRRRAGRGRLQIVS